MNAPTLVVSIILFLLIPAITRGQSIARMNQPAGAAGAIAAGEITALMTLKHLQDQVIIHRSLGDFEADRRLARVPLQAFEAELLEATNEVEPILAKMPASKLKTELANALASYRDGVYWWRKIDRPRVIDVSALAYDERDVTAAEAAFLASAPYTVAINWRQAARYLARAEALLKPGREVIY